MYLTFFGPEANLQIYAFGAIKGLSFKALYKSLQMQGMSSFYCSLCSVNKRRLLISDPNMEDTQMFLHPSISNSVYMCPLICPANAALEHRDKRVYLLRCGESLININIFLSSLSIE